MGRLRTVYCLAALPAHLLRLLLVLVYQDGCAPIEPSSNVVFCSAGTTHLFVSFFCVDIIFPIRWSIAHSRALCTPSRLSTSRPLQATCPQQQPSWATW